jgi:O-antigen/teichoic acid export membrane protein
VNPWGEVEKLTIQLMSSNTTRIAKNTLMLYFRQILIMLVSLYTVRVVLNTLGAEDYGIYNVVAGVVTMFGFLSSTMSGATQRFLSIEIGRSDFDRLKRVFSLSLTIYMLFVVIVLLLAETAGLWFITNKLIIPAERKGAALWTYQFSILSFLFTILTAPYMAAVIAHEDMNIYAYVSILEVVLKLVMVFLLNFIAWDKLKVYGILVCGATIINTTIYRTVCMFKYQECKFKFFWEKGLFNEIVYYTKWSILGVFSDVFKYQAILLLLNQYFNPIVITAHSIASSVRNIVSNFSWNFNYALRPQIVKYYAIGQKEEMTKLMFYGVKGTYFLMYLI